VWYGAGTSGKGRFSLSQWLVLTVLVQLRNSQGGVRRRLFSTTTELSSQVPKSSTPGATLGFPMTDMGTVYAKSHGITVESTATWSVLFSPVSADLACGPSSTAKNAVQQGLSGVVVSSGGAVSSLLLTDFAISKGDACVGLSRRTAQPASITAGVLAISDGELPHDSALQVEAGLAGLTIGGAKAVVTRGRVPSLGETHTYPGSQSSGSAGSGPPVAIIAGAAAGGGTLLITMAVLGYFWQSRRAAAWQAVSTTVAKDDLVKDDNNKVEAVFVTTAPPMESSGEDTTSVVRKSSEAIGGQSSRRVSRLTSDST